MTAQKESDGHIEWLRNFIFGDKDNAPMVTYLPRMSEVDGHFNAIKKEITSLQSKIAKYEKALSEIEIFEIMCTQDMKLPMEIAKQELEEGRK